MTQNELIAQLIQQIMSNLPLGPLLGSMVGGPVTNWLSPSSSMSNALIWPGQAETIGQASFNYMEGMRSRGFNIAASRLQEEQQIRALTEYHRMLNPSMSDIELRGLAQNSAKNPFDVGGLLYQYLDPYKLNQGLAEASTLSSILHRRGSTFTIAGAQYASAISDAIYNKDSGIINDIIDNPSSYGNLSVAGVMQVGRELALTDRTGFKGDTGNFDSSRFKQRIQEVSQALEPWQDIFGKDIPKVLNQLEALTGASIGSTNSGDILRMGNRMTSILGATGARIQHIAAYKDNLAQGLIDPTMSNRSILGAAALASDLTLGLANLSSNTLTSAELQSSIGAFYAGTAKSKYAERYALAYARYADSNRDTATTAKFNEILNTAMTNGKTPQEALLEASGARNLDELEMYRGTDAYVSAIKTGDAAKMARDVSLSNETLNTFMKAYSSSGGYRAYSQTARDYLAGLSKDELVDFLGKTKSQKQAILEGIGIDRQESIQVAADIESASTRALSTTLGRDVSPDYSREAFSSASNYRRQNAQAREIENFTSKVRELYRPGGLSSVLREIQRTGGNADFFDLAKSYFGGSDILAAMAYSQVGLSEEEIRGNEDMFRQSMNFVRNNYGNIATDYSEIYDMISSKDKATIRKGHRLAAELNAVGAKALGNLTEEEREALLDRLSRTDLSSKKEDIGKVSRDFMIDTNIIKTIAELSEDGKLNDKNMSRAASILTDMTKGQYTSKEQITKELEEKYGKDKDLMKSFKDIMSSAKIGDIDGVDPLHKIAGFLEGLPGLLEKLITALNQKDNK